MAGASQIEAGAAFVRLFTKDAGLRKGLDAAAKRVGAFADRVTSLGLKIAGLGAAGVTGLVALSKSFADAGSKIFDASLRTGASAEALQELGYAAEQSGGSMDDVVGSIGKMNKFIGAAAGGSKESAAMLNSLGLSLEQLKGMSPDQQFEAIADSLSQLGTDAELTNAAMTVFGKGAGALLPMFKTWRTDTAAARQELRKLGGVMSNEDVKAADALGDSFGLLAKSIGAIKNAIGASLAPLLTNLAGIITENVALVGQWVSANRGAVISALAIAAGVTAAGVALVAFGVSAKILAVALAGVSAVIGAIVSPLGLMTIAVGAGIAAFLTFNETGKQIAADIASAFEELKGEVTTALGAIGQALAAGDIAAAAKVLWALLKLEWTKGVHFLLTEWNGFTTGMLKAGNEAFFGLAKLMADPINQMQQMWTKFQFFLADTWTIIKTGWESLWDNLVNYATKKTFEIEGVIQGVDKSDLIAAVDQNAIGQKEALKEKALGEIGKSDEAKKKQIAALAALESDEVKKLEARRLAGIANINNAQLDAEKNLADARAEFDKAVADAKQAAFNAHLDKIVNGKGDAEGAGAGGNPLDLQAAKQSVAGTFNPFAALGLGGNTVQEKILTEAQKARLEAIEQRKILRDLLIWNRQHPPGAFGP